jgi:hypothetical protein
MKTPDQEIREARDADSVLNNPVFKNAVDGIERNLIERMKQVPMADLDTQHELILSLQLLGALKRSLSDTIQTGKMAEIQKEQSLAQKVKRFVRN